MLIFIRLCKNCADLRINTILLDVWMLYQSACPEQFSDISHIRTFSSYIISALIAAIDEKINHANSNTQCKNNYRIFLCLNEKIVWKNSTSECVGGRGEYQFKSETKRIAIIFFSSRKISMLRSVSPIKRLSL